MDSLPHWPSPDHELTVFEAAFDDYFQPTPERPAANAKTTPTRRTHRPPRRRLSRPASLRLTTTSWTAYAATRYLMHWSRRTKARCQSPSKPLRLEAKVEEISLFTQRGQYVRKILDALGDEALREAAIEFEQSEPAAFEAVQALREQLRERVRDRVERAYLIHAAAATEDLSGRVAVQTQTRQYRSQPDGALEAPNGSHGT